MQQVPRFDTHELAAFFDIREPAFSQQTIKRSEVN
jgi:hypothetical protein